MLFIIDNKTIKYHLHTTYITVACCLRASMIVKVKIARLQLILNKPQLLRINFGYVYTWSSTYLRNCFPKKICAKCSKLRIKLALADG